MKLFRSRPREKARQIYYFPLFKPRTKRDPNSADYDVGESFRGTNRRDENVLKLEYACKKKKEKKNTERTRNESHTYLYTQTHTHSSTRSLQIPTPTPLPQLFLITPSSLFSFPFSFFSFFFLTNFHSSLSIPFQSLTWPMVISSCEQWWRAETKLALKRPIKTNKRIPIRM